jgi:glutathione synthase/RimK-type ligase-like ATP-grasp enzyme
MEIVNNERTLIRAIREIAKELRLTFDTFSQDWIVRLKGENQTKYIFGYNFDLNGTTGHLITNDKCAASELLNDSKIPAVEHRLFLHPGIAGYVTSEGNWREILSYFKNNGSDIVCKSNTGTGGNQVYRARNPLGLELAVHTLFSSNRAIALSPFINIDSEYRLIMLGGTCELAYEKVRPAVTGDGHSTVAELILKSHSAHNLDDKILSGLSKEGGDILSIIPEQDERFVYSWKHNLGKGAKAVEVNDETLKTALSELAISCMNALNLTFVSVDIIKANNRLLVLEINSGVMMESYSRQGDKEYEKAKDIYRKAVIKMFSEN